MTARVQRQLRRSRGPFSRPIDINRVPEGGLAQSLMATAEECAAIAAEITMPGIRALTADLEVRLISGGRFEVRCYLKAEITHRCVVTLELFDSVVDQSVELLFAPSEPDPITAGQHGSRHGQQESLRVTTPLTVAGMDDGEDLPDPIIDDMIDLGEVATEFLALALDPYPRKPGVHFSDIVVREKDEPKT